ncbi:unnamed protein product [Nezara viridula]|uniref:Uncharacterized protein n=1 Tax=Nezara viridula TaxID=85310 RepID=A0A9P0MWN2_NEZVI|nr:unnamed protein product [Nezara viridula]
MEVIDSFDKVFKSAAASIFMNGIKVVDGTRFLLKRKITTHKKRGRELRVERVVRGRRREKKWIQEIGRPSLKK